MLNEKITDDIDFFPDWSKKKTECSFTSLLHHWHCITASYTLFFGVHFVSSGKNCNFHGTPIFKTTHFIWMSFLFLSLTLVSFILWVWMVLCILSHTKSFIMQTPNHRIEINAHTNEWAINVFQYWIDSLWYSMKQIRIDPVSASQRK